MADPRHVLGLAAEAAVERWLCAAGWTILGRRVRPTAGSGEIDLVAVDPSGMLVAVEVRARRTARTGGAAASVDARRMRRLGRALAAVGAVSGRRAHVGLRIDLVTVEPTRVPGRWRLARIPGVG